MSAHSRRKEPQKNRQLILEAALQLIPLQGVQAITLQRVAEAAGLTKGGLLHHFPTKEHLLKALSAMVLELVETEIEAAMAADPLAHGRFSRAYLQVCLTPEGISPAAMAALWGDAGLRHAWYVWLGAQEARHHATDGTPALKLVRLAADGLWLAMTEGQPAEPWLDALRRATLAP